MATHLQDKEQAKKRLSEIESDRQELKEEAQEACDEVLELMQQARRKALEVLNQRREMEDLRAEALYISVLHDWDTPERQDLESRGDKLEALSKEIRSVMQPVRPRTEWLEKIREVELSRSEGPVLSEAEKEELERRLKDNVCPICVSFSLDGTCTLQAFETCPITLYLSRLVGMIEDLGHRPWMEDYFERMYRDICPGCQGRIDKDHCPPREEGDCSLFTYLPTVVRTVESFMEEREKAREAS